MILKQAIQRRIRLGKSFCSYDFTPKLNSQHSFIIHARRDENYLLKKTKLCSTQATTQKTINLQTSRLKQSSTRSIRTLNKNEKKEEKRRRSKFLLAEKIFSQQMSSHQSVKKKKINKMQEYLQDFQKLRQGFEWKIKKYENIPKILTKKNNPSKQKPQINSQYGFYEDIQNGNDRWQGSGESQIYIFNPKQFPFLFYDFSFHQNREQCAFTILRIINIALKSYIQLSISENLFSDLLIKQHYQKLNNFSLKLEDNIYYLALSKNRLTTEDYPYTECFFWISKPIMHYQRNKVLLQIKKFLKQCSNILKNQAHKLLGPKIWIIDFNGKISYMNENQLQEGLNEQVEKQEKNRMSSNSISCKNLSEVYLNLFLSSINRGVFSNHTTPHQNLIEVEKGEKKLTF